MAFAIVGLRPATAFAIAGGTSLSLTPGGSFTYTSGSAGAYTPVMTMSFSGTLGNVATAYFSYNRSGRETFSADVAGPHGEAQVLKLTIPQWDGVGSSASMFFGGGLVGSSFPLDSDQDLWFRLYHYFPTSFCAGADSAGDYWGPVKWVRVEWTDGAKMTYELGGFNQGSCASAASAPYPYLGTKEYFPDQSNMYFPTQVVLQRDQWVALQFHMHTGSSGFLEGWVDDTYLGRANASIIPSTFTNKSIGSIVIGDYWNGGSYQANTWYVQDLIATTQTPDTLDSGGLPYIAPSAKVADFA